MTIQSPNVESLKISSKEEKRKWRKKFVRCESLPIDLNQNQTTIISEKPPKYSQTIERYHIYNIDELPDDCQSPTAAAAANSGGPMTGYQLLILILLSYGNFWIAACVSLQAPFFPKEAESKGATPTEYGLVFGIYELMIAITSPLFGKLIANVSPLALCELGLVVSGFSTALFGLLDRLNFGVSFIIMCIGVRIIEGIASAAFMTASYAIITKEFTDRIATSFSTLQTFFGLGLILGPTLGGALYQLGGYMLPFIVLGSFLLLGGVAIFLLIEIEIKTSQQKSGNFLEFISDSGTLLDALAIAMSLNFIGFNAVTLEPHLRQFNLSPLLIGSIFIIFGATHAIITPIWGKLCENGISPKKLCIIGYLLCTVGYLFIGPQFFIPIEPQLWLIVVSLIFIGLGLASKLITAFISTLNDSINRRGFPDDMSTYGLVSAMYFSANSIGAFIGPTLGGFLLDTIGYRNSTLVILIIDLILLTLLVIYLITRNRKRRYFKSIDEIQPLLQYN
ncbi:MFS-type transporter SLC18B1-like [Oppia nitens]|uniref:MFS-type transporter SLC18B1-like n=1 Tax=Oppia nitens TaxID=1686743 RepID=UPI0023D9CCCF|nr:MFS-type transporter SLC18B1-like [Oppia nitens]